MEIFVEGPFVTYGGCKMRTSIPNVESMANSSIPKIHSSGRLARILIKCMKVMLAVSAITNPSPGKMAFVLENVSLSLAPLLSL